MGASDDDDEYVVYGKPLQDEVESARGQYCKELQDKAVTKALPVWQQVSCSVTELKVRSWYAFKNLRRQTYRAS